MSEPHARNLAAVIADRLRELREVGQMRQEDVAESARRWGFQWTRATVAAIEAGRRKLSVEEFLLLPMFFRAQLSELANFFSEDEWIELTPETKVRSEALRSLLLGKRGETKLSDYDIPEMRTSQKIDQERGQRRAEVSA